LLVGREDLKSGEIENDEIEDGEIKNNKEDIGIIDCEKFFLNYINRYAISIHSANLIINKIAIEITNMY
jgi:hypothetical protein